MSELHQGYVKPPHYLDYALTTATTGRLNKCAQRIPSMLESSEVRLGTRKSLATLSPASVDELVEVQDTNHRPHLPHAPLVAQ